MYFKHLIKIANFILCFSFFLKINAQTKTARNYADNFIDLLEKKDFKEAYNLLAIDNSSFTESQFTNAMNGTTTMLGDLKSYSFNCEEIQETGVLLYYDMKFEKGDVLFKFSTDKNSNIRGFVVAPTSPCSVKYENPAYATKQNYIDTEVVIKGDVEVNASIMTPKENKKDIICLFLAGSGKQDKDASIGPNKIFMDLSLGLAVNGITSVRFGKRDLTKIKNETLISIEKEYVEDVISIISYIKNQKEFDNYKIFLVGHSLGGMIAPKLSTLSKEIDGIILMGANFRPLEDLILEQMIHLASLNRNDTSKKQELEIQRIKKQVSYVKDSLTITSKKEKLPLSVVPSYWISLEKYYLNTKKRIKKIKKPVLVLWGEKDYQVPKKDYLLYKENLGKKATFKSYPELNHIFHISDGQLSPEEYKNQGNIPEYVINDISDWVSMFKK